MFESLRNQLDTGTGDPTTWEELRRQAVSEAVRPGTPVRSIGDAVTDVLVIAQGLFEVAAPGSAAQWATAGATIGLAAALSGAPSLVTVTALRQGRLSRVPASAIGAHYGKSPASFATIARLAIAPDHGLVALPPDPLVVTALLEQCDDATTREITEHLESAANALSDVRVVRITPSRTEADLAAELAAHEVGAATVVYIVEGAHGARAADVVAHADRVIVFQPFGVEHDTSEAFAVACDGSAMRHAQLVYVRSQHEPVSTTTQRLSVPPNVKQIHLLREPPAAQLQMLLTDLRQGARDYEVLREFEVFADLSDAELATIQRSLRWERVDGGSTLLRQGDLATDAWLIRAGRLEVVQRTSAGERHVSWLGPGAFVAEIGLLTGARRVASVRAVRDSAVARLDPLTVESLLSRSPRFTRMVARILATRAGGKTDYRERRARTIAVIPLGGTAHAGAFVTALAAVCEEDGVETIVVDAARLNATLGPDASNTRRGDVGDTEIIGWLDQLEHHYALVILVGESAIDSWTRRAVRQSDHILFVADASTDPALRAIERELRDVAASDAAPSRTHRDGESFGGARHLVLLQPSGMSEATGTGRWLDQRPDHLHHHVRSDEHGDVARLARRLTGRAVALALSGASSRAPAHFGVVRALHDHQLPIDLLSGSSSGAGVASMIACGFGAEEGLAKALEIITKGPPRMRHFQPPITALTSGAHADRTLQAVFGNRQLEDQFIPAIVTAVDIRRHRAVHLTRGPIWKLVRASGSLPLLWPPVWHEDDLLVDGAIINFLPVEVFGDQAADGLIIASNLDETAGVGAPAFKSALRYGTVLNSWGELLRRFRRSGTARAPSLVSILYHTMAIPSFQQLEGLQALAERDNVCLITPPIGSFGLFDVKADTGKKLETIAWQHAHTELKRVAARWHSRLEWRTATTAVPTPASAAAL